MTDRELLELALDAISGRYESELDKAEEALRDRLAQPEQVVSVEEYRRLQELVTSQGIRLMEYESAQPEQEPFCFHDGRNIVGKEYADHSDVFPLYTSPNPEQQKPVRFNCTVIDDAHLNGVPLSQWGKQHEMQPCAGRNCGSTNPNLHSAECFEDYEKATGMTAQQPCIEELEHENRLMRARNERLQAEVERLEEQSEKRQYHADHVVLEKGTNDCVCTHCGQRYHIHMPVPIGIMTAIVDAFLEAHHQCEKPEAA